MVMTKSYYFIHGPNRQRVTIPDCRRDDVFYLIQPSSDEHPVEAPPVLVTVDLALAALGVGLNQPGLLVDKAVPIAKGERVAAALCLAVVNAQPRHIALAICGRTPPRRLALAFIP